MGTRNFLRHISIDLVFLSGKSLFRRTISGQQFIKKKNNTYWRMCVPLDFGGAVCAGGALACCLRFTHSIYFKMRNTKSVIIDIEIIKG